MSSLTRIAIVILVALVAIWIIATSVFTGGRSSRLVVVSLIISLAVSGFFVFSVSLRTTHVSYTTTVALVAVFVAVAAALAIFIIHFYITVVVVVVLVSVAVAVVIMIIFDICVVCSCCGAVVVIVPVVAPSTAPVPTLPGGEVLLVPAPVYSCEEEPVSFDLDF